MKKFLRVTFTVALFTLALTAACQPSNPTPESEHASTHQTSSTPTDDPSEDETPALSITPAVPTPSETEATTAVPTLSPTPVPIPTPDLALLQLEKVEQWVEQTTPAATHPVLEWHDVRIASPTPEATPTPPPTPTPKQQLSPRLNDRIEAVFSGEEEYEPSAGIFTATLDEKYENMRHKWRNTWPATPADMFSDVPVTADVRKELIAHAKHLLELPYVYPRHNPYWAEGSGYSSNWIELRLSLEDGLHDHVNSEGQLWTTYAIGPDCASYIKAVYDYVLGSALSDYVPTIYDWYRSAAPELMKDINDSTQWIPGDLFILRDLDTSLRHIAIYLGEGRLIHSVGHKVQMSHMNEWSFRSRGTLYIAAVVAPPGVQVPEEDALFDTTSWTITNPTPFPTYRPEGSPTPIPEQSADDVEAPPTQQDSDLYDEATPTPTPLPDDEAGD